MSQIMDVSSQIIGTLDRIGALVASINAVPKAGMDTKDLNDFDTALVATNLTLSYIKQQAREHPMTKKTFETDKITGQTAYITQLAQTVAWSTMNSLKYINASEAKLLADYSCEESAIPEYRFLQQSVIGDKRCKHTKLGGKSGRTVETFDYVEIPADDRASLKSVPGFVMHINTSSVQTFYMQQIPFQAILAHVYKLRSSGNLNNHLTFTLLASGILACYYHLVWLCRNYVVLCNRSTALNHGGSAPRFDCFDFLLQPLEHGSDYTWNKLVGRMKTVMSETAEDYRRPASSANKLQLMGADFDPSELAKDPSKITSLIEKFTGGNAGDMDMAKMMDMPFFSFLKDMMPKGAIADQ